tara:strand:- start:318 stop:566 length:249 start_codon:yes stop_codon:yes gene_type:complete
VVEELAQNIADHVGKLIVNDNGLRDFNGHCPIYFDVSVVDVINSHGESLLTLKCEFDQLAQATNSNRQITNLQGGVEYGAPG